MVGVESLPLKAWGLLPRAGKRLIFQKAKDGWGFPHTPPTTQWPCLAGGKLCCSLPYLLTQGEEWGWGIHEALLHHPELPSVSTWRWLLLALTSWQPVATQAQSRRCFSLFDFLEGHPRTPPPHTHTHAFLADSSSPPE